MAKRYYYHITEQKWPRSITLNPRSDGRNRDEREPETARICVAPSPAHCLIALGGCIGGHAIYIYRTEEEVVARNPHGVEDSCVTKEKWVVSSTRFVKIKTISKKEMAIIECLTPDVVGTKEDVPEQKEALKILEKIDALAP